MTPATVEPVQPSKQHQPCGPNRYRSDDDLCAQWKAADAARDAAKWAARSFWIGIVGTLGLFVTLYYTRKAVLAAEDATKDAETAIEIAERNAGAAMRLAEISEQTAQRQLRAYVFIEKGRFSNHVVLTWWGAAFTTKNSGQTPAHDITIYVKMSAGARPEEVEMTPEYLSPTFSLGPNSEAEHDLKFPARYTRDDLNALDRGEDRFWVSMRYHYMDAFGNRQEGQATFRVVGVGQLVVHTEGNWMT